MKRSITLIMLIFCMASLTGCYTKLASHQGDNVPSRFGECHGDECWEDVAPTSARQREVCVWERDILGFPHMRCYTTNFHNSWVYFHNTPWWYRDQFHFHNSRGCPPYYYFDRFSGMCRHHNRWPHGGGGGGGGGNRDRAHMPTPSSQFPEQPSRRIEPDLEPATSATMFDRGGTLRPMSPAPAPIPRPQTPPLGSGTTDKTSDGQTTPPAHSRPTESSSGSQFVAPPSRNRNTDEQSRPNTSSEQPSNNTIEDESSRPSRRGR